MRLDVGISLSVFRIENARTRAIAGEGHDGAGFRNRLTTFRERPGVGEKSPPSVFRPLQTLSRRAFKYLGLPEGIWL